jgi:hypothetical protein
MKMINCDTHIQISTDKLKLANGDNLYYSFIFTIFGGPARFYYRLVTVIYDILYEDDYFNEEYF